MQSLQPQRKRTLGLGQFFQPFAGIFVSFLFAIRSIISEPKKKKCFLRYFLRAVGSIYALLF